MRSEKWYKKMTWLGVWSNKAMRGERRSLQKAGGVYGGWFRSIGEAYLQRTRAQQCQTKLKYVNLQKRKMSHLGSHRLSTPRYQITCFKKEKRGSMWGQLLELKACEKTMWKFIRQAGGSIKNFDKRKAAALCLKSNEGEDGKYADFRGRLRKVAATCQNKLHRKRQRTWRDLTLWV